MMGLNQLFLKWARGLVILLLLCWCGSVTAAEAVRSYHVGLLHPNGVDVVGYSVERRVSDHVFRFYNFGFPSLAAIGVNYYSRYQGNGTTATLGVGVGSVLYASLAYQQRLSEDGFLKLGLGLTAGVAYSGVYPVLAYERRF